MKIFRIQEYNYDCDDNKYYFINDDAILIIKQMLNCDLLFFINTFNKTEKEVVFSIKKSKFESIYLLINKMLNNIENNKYLLGKRLRPEYIELYKNGYFSFMSDAPSNEEDWNTKNNFIYNYFNIIPLKDEYELKFINNTNNEFFSIEVNTDRSRYDRFGFEVFDFFKNLKNVIDIINKEDLNIEIKQFKLSKLKSNNT